MKRSTPQHLLLGLGALCTFLWITGCPKTNVLKQNSGDDGEKVASSDAGSASPQTSPTVVRRAAPPPRVAAVPASTANTTEELFEEASKNAATNPTVAMQKFKQVLEKQPQSYQSWYNIGVLYERAGNALQGETSYRKALQYKPDFYPAVINLVRLYLRQKRSGQATTLLQNKSTRFPNNLKFSNALIYMYIRQGQLGMAERMARNIQKKDEKNADAVINLGLVWYKQSKYELARTAFNIASTSAPNSAVPQYYLGCVYDKLKDPLAAIESLQKALKLQDAYPEAHNLLGVLMMRRGKVKEAKEHFARAVGYMPRFWQANLNLGISMAALKEFKDASEIYKKLIRTFPYEPESHYHLGILYLDGVIKPEQVSSSGYIIPAAIQNSKRILKILNKIALYSSAITHLSAYVSRKKGLSSEDPARGYLEDATKKREREKKVLQRTIKRELKRYLRKSTRRARPAPPARRGAAAPKPR